jgi:hypothetical protein
MKTYPEGETTVPPRHRRRGRAATGASVVTATSPVIAMTDARTCRAHLVADEAFTAGRANAGRYVTVCGIVVLAASLTTPETSYCASCAYWRRHGNREGMDNGG